MSVKTEGGDKPVVVGTTNLPDGIELMVTIRRKESSYMSQTKTRVKDGAFRAGPFLQRGYSLVPGIYSIEVSSSLAFLQPPPTWSTIGSDGSRLEGPLAKQSPFGGGKIVEYETSLKVAADKGSPVQDRAVQPQTDKDEHESWLKACKDTCNVLQRVAQRRGEAFNWDRCYYKCLADEPSKKK